MQKLFVVLLAIAPALLAQERKVEPTWLYRDVSALREHDSDLTSNSCHYTPIFGEGDIESQLQQSVTRFGELTVDAHGTCQAVEYQRQEELYFERDERSVLHYGHEPHPLSQHD